MTRQERNFVLLTTQVNNRDKLILNEQTFVNEELMQLVLEEALKDPNIRTIIAYHKVTGEVLLEERKNNQ